MLVLRMRVGEEFYIGPDIKIAITDIDGRRVAFGIDAPKSVRVQRHFKPGACRDCGAEGIHLNADHLCCLCDTRAKIKIKPERDFTEHDLLTDEQERKLHADED